MEGINQMSKFTFIDLIFYIANALTIYTLIIFSFFPEEKAFLIPFSIFILIQVLIGFTSSLKNKDKLNNKRN